MAQTVHWYKIKISNKPQTKLNAYIQNTGDTLCYPQSHTYLPTLENQKTEYKVLRGSEATKPEVAKRPRGGGGGGCGRGVSPLRR